MICGALASLTLAEPSNDRWNWSHTIEFAAKEVERPANLAELQSVIKSAPGKVKTVGTAHCFSDIADTDGTHILLEKMNGVEVDAEAMTVTFGAGITYS